VTFDDHRGLARGMVLPTCGSGMRKYDADGRVHSCFNPESTYARCNYRYGSYTPLHGPQTNNPLTCIWCIVINWIDERCII
jgi:hypothetical protein